jgi:putative PIN family toxin of toxin-antitoxin system
LYRVVFDTNVLLSAFIFGGNPEKLFDLARFGEIRLIVSPEILMEFAYVLKEKFAWAEGDIAEAMQAIGYSSELVRPPETIRAVSDDADNRILECAVEGNADFIVSGDHHLLDLGAYEGIKIASPKGFLRYRV